MKIIPLPSLVLLTALILMIVPPAGADTAWTPPDGVPVYNALDIGRHTYSATNDAGETLITWYDNRLGDPAVYGQVLDSQGQPLWEEDGRMIADRPGFQRPFDVLAIGEDWYLLWGHLGPNFDKYTPWDLFSQRITPDGELLWSEDNQPALGRVFIASTSSTLPAAQAVAGPGNTFYLSWIGDDELFVHRQLATGELDPAWNPSGIMVAGSDIFAGSHHTLLPGSDGTALIAWTAYDAFRAQKVASDGSSLWQEDGILVETSDEFLIRPDTAPDGSGGFFAAWTNQTQIRVQHISSTGQRLWTDVGEALTSLSPLGPPSIHPVGADQAVVLFNGASRLRAQKISGQQVFTRWWSEPGGTVDDGVILYDEELVDVPDHAMHSDGNNGIVVAWWEWEIATRIQHVRANGELMLEPGGLVVQNVDRRFPSLSFSMDEAANNLVLAEASFSYGSGTYAVLNHRYASDTGELLTEFGGLPVIAGDGGNTREAYSLWANTVGIFAQALDPESGAHLFEGEGVKVLGLEEPGSLDNLLLTPITDGGILTSHQQSSNSFSLQRMTAIGELPWGEDGITIVYEEAFLAIPYSLLPAADGGVFVTMYGTNAPFESNVAVQLFDSNGVPQWSVNNQSWLMLDPSGPSVDDPVISGRTGNGNYVVCWKNTDGLKARAITPEGELLGTEPLLLSDIFHHDIEVDLVTVEDGLIVAWRDEAEGEHHLHATKLNNDGTVAWDQPSLVENDQYGAMVEFQLSIADPAGDSFWISWRDATSNPQQINTQRLATADGSEMNEAVVVYEGDARDPRLVMMENEDALLVWKVMDGNYHSDLLYRRVRQDGQFAPGYEQPQYLCAAPGPQRPISLERSGTGGAYATWIDRRGGGDQVYSVENIYAQRTFDTVDSVDGRDNAARPDTWTLNEVYPNPFNGTTTVTLTLPQSETMRVTLFDILGREVMQLRNGRIAAGQHRLVLDANHLASGMYFLRASVDGQGMQMRKLMLLR